MVNDGLFWCTSISCLVCMYLACVVVWNKRNVEPKLGKGHGHSRSRLDTIKHVWDQLFTVDTIWNIGETGDMYFSSISWLADLLGVFKVEHWW